MGTQGGFIVLCNRHLSSAVVPMQMITHRNKVVGIICKEVLGYFVNFRCCLGLCPSMILSCLR